MDVGSLKVLRRVKRHIPVHCIENGQHDFLSLPFALPGTLSCRVLEQRLSEVPRDLVHPMERNWWDITLTLHRFVYFLQRNLDCLVLSDLPTATY